MEVQQVCKDLQIGGVEGEAAMTVDIQEGKSAKDGKPSLGNQEPVLESSGEGMAVLDFDVLCATVAMQSEGLSFEIRSLSGRESGGGVQRMWEGGLLDCLDNREISLRTACCPCSTFGKNVQRAGFGTCFGQGTVHFLLGTCALISYIAFGVTKLHALLYIALAFTLSLAVYAGYFRTQIRKRFNIKEARTLEMNNVQDGIWHGRGDTVLVGSYKESHNSSQDLEQPTVLTTSPAECIMNKEDHAWNRLSDQSEPLVGSKL